MEKSEIKHVRVGDTWSLQAIEEQIITILGTRAADLGRPSMEEARGMIRALAEVVMKEKIAASKESADAILAAMGGKVLETRVEKRGQGPELN